MHVNNRTTTKNIVVLISGAGSNLAAILHAERADQWRASYGAQVACVVSNRADAAGLLIARQAGIATAVVPHQAFAACDQPRAAFDAALQQALDAYEPFLVVLAGFMRILTPAFVAHYRGRLVNIHPSLLPSFAGLDTHQRAIDAGCRFAGATVHWVTDDLDHGPILAQAVVPILPGDSADTLAQRVRVQEHWLYPRTLAQLLAKPLA